MSAGQHCYDHGARGFASNFHIISVSRKVKMNVAFVPQRAFFLVD